MVAAQRQQSANINHKRIEIGAPHSGQPHITTSPRSCSAPSADV
jgi:hypothetical protein